MKHTKIELNEVEYAKLYSIIEDPASGKELRKRCQILLALDSNHEKVPTYVQIQREYDVSKKTIANVKKAMLTGGIDNAINRKKREYREKLHEEMKNEILKLVDSRAYTPRGTWSVRALTQVINQLYFDNTVSRETIRHFLRQNGIDLKEEHSDDTVDSDTTSPVSQYGSFTFGYSNDDDELADLNDIK